MDTKDTIMEIIECIGYLTGSRRFGFAQDDADWDYVILYRDFEKELNRKRIRIIFSDPNKEQNIPSFITTDKGIYNEGNLFRSYRIQDDSYVFNILMVWSNAELETWKEATKIIQMLPLYLVKDKKNRTLLFEAIKQAVRTSGERSSIRKDIQREPNNEMPNL